MRTGNDGIYWSQKRNLCSENFLAFSLPSRKHCCAMLVRVIPGPINDSVFQNPQKTAQKIFGIIISSSSPASLLMKILGGIDSVQNLKWKLGCKGFGQQIQTTLYSDREISTAVAEMDVTQI